MLRMVQVVNMKTFTSKELRMVEMAVQLLSDAVLGLVRGVNLVRQAVGIARRGRSFVRQPTTSGEAFRDGSDKTVAIYDNITLNDQALFIGDKSGSTVTASPLSAMTVVHELGHVTGWSAGMLAEFNKRFVGAAATLRTAPMTWYAATAQDTEFFPEAFAIYNADPEWMRTNLPEMFKWFESLSKSGTAPTSP
jgi:hypothetical protein